jgi:cytochrome c
MKNAPSFKRTTFFLFGAAILTMTNTAATKGGNIEHGKHLARLHCARCHSIDKVGPSPLSIAPPFRTLHKRYPIDTLEETLAEGIFTGHPSMPEFRFDGDQINDFLSYLKTLE